MTNIKDWINEIGYYDEVADTRKRALVYGPTGVGKTMFASTWPKPLFIDTDRGGETLRKLHVPHIPVYYNDRAWEKVKSIIDALAAGTAPFDELEVQTVVIDSATALASMILYESMLYPSRPGQTRRDPVKDKPQYDDYNAVLTRLGDIVLRCKDLPMHTVFLAGVKLERDEVSGTYIGKPNIVGSYRDTIGHDFDEVYYMETEGVGDRVKYMLHTQKHRYYDAKSRYGLRGSVQNPKFEALYAKEESDA